MSRSRVPLNPRSSTAAGVIAGPLPGLVVCEGVLAGMVFYLTSDLTTIGQAPNNDIQLSYRHVEPHHACVRRQRAAQRDVFQVYDLVSAAGVQVNGATITMRHPLTDGDRIAIGSAVFEFFIQGGDDQVQPDSVL